jgi:hypothetical protein
MNVLFSYLTGTEGARFKKTEETSNTQHATPNIEWEEGKTGTEKGG